MELLRGDSQLQRYSVREDFTVSHKPRAGWATMGGIFTNRIHGSKKDKSRKHSIE